jgi:hypothetical protein
MTEAHIERVYILTTLDESPDLSWLEQSYNDPSIAPDEALRMRAADAERLAAYRQGDWYMVGIQLAVEVVLARPGRVDEVITLTTPGLWGVESDSGDEYFRSIADDESSYLVDDLVALGFARDLVQVRIACELEADRAVVIER